MIAAVVALEALWLLACEMLRERAPGALLAFVIFPWMLFAAAWRRTLPGRGAPLRLIAWLWLADVALDLLSPYPQRLAFLVWEIARAVAILLGAAVAPRLPTILVKILRGFSLGVALVIPTAMTYVGITGARDETSPADAALVLGFALDERGEPRPQLLGRLEHAIDLQRRAIVPRLVLSGGVAKAGHTEASVMRELALARGVPQEALVVEDASRSTIENFACSLPLLDGLGARRVLVVTEPWHMRRAMLLARRHGLDARASPAESAISRSPRHAVFWLFRDATVFVFELVRSPWAHPGNCAAKTCEGCRRF